MIFNVNPGARIERHMIAEKSLIADQYQNSGFIFNISSKYIPIQDMVPTVIIIPKALL